MSDNQVFKTPTQPLDLPSKGFLYPESNPLSSGQVELNMPSAKDEDILTNRNYIEQNIVLDKFLQSIIASKIDYDDLLVGDKNAILVAARILAYGSQYTFNYTDPVTRVAEPVTIDLGDIKDKEIDWSKFTKGVNELDIKLPTTGATITVKLMTHRDEMAIEAEIKAMKKFNKNASIEVTSRLNQTILAVNGDRTTATIRNFVKSMPMRDTKEMKKVLALSTPDLEMKFDFTRSNGEVVEGLTIPMTVDFFWPES